VPSSGIESAAGHPFVEGSMRRAPAHRRRSAKS
jgi:hypothetical protein